MSGYCLGRVLQPPQSGLQGSLLISLQSGRNGRRRKGCAWVCVQVLVCASVCAWLCVVVRRGGFPKELSYARVGKFPVAS